MITINRKNPTAGEITSSLTNSTDGTGLHFDGAAGNIDIASPPNLGTKFSFEFIIQADSIPASGYAYIADFGTGGRFAVASINGDLAIYDTGIRTFGVSFLDDLKVHHLVVTVDGTSAIAYDNGNQVGTATLGAISDIDDCTDAIIGRYTSSAINYFTGTIYRARFWNKTLSQAEVTASYENATVPTLDRYGRQAITDGGFTVSGNWSPTGGWSVSGNKANFTDGSGTGKISQTCFTSADAGKKVSITFTVGTGAAYIWTGNAAGSVGYVDGGYVTYAIGTHTVSFTLPSGSTTLGFYSGNDAAGNFDVSNMSVHVEGVVSDYDLAFANPTQSRMVQDRAGAADGTSSATGVSQVTPLEQVNTNKISVGGVTPLVGIGLAAGTVPSTELHVAGVYPANKIRSEDTTDGTYVEVYASAGSAYLASSSGDVLRLAPGGSTKMLLDTAGNAGLGVTPETWDSSYTALQFAGNGALGGWGNQQAGAAIFLSQNSYLDPTAWKYISTDEASRYEQVNGTHTFSVATSGTADAAITWTDALTISSAGLATFSNGIAFSSQTDTTTGTTTATTLNHYEEGTFSPEFGGSTTDPTDSYTSQTGFYVRIGNTVHVQGYVQLAASGITPGTGVGLLKNLPFTVSASGSAANSALCVGYTDSWLTGYFGAATGGFFYNSTTYARLTVYDNSSGKVAGITYTDARDIDESAAMIFSGTYMV